MIIPICSIRLSVGTWPKRVLARLSCSSCTQLFVLKSVIWQYLHVYIPFYETSLSESMLQFISDRMLPAQRVESVSLSSTALWDATWFMTLHSQRLSSHLCVFFVCRFLDCSVQDDFHKARVISSEPPFFPKKKKKNNCEELNYPLEPSVDLFIFSVQDA